MGAADLQRIPSGFVRETPTNIDGRHRALDHQTTAGEALPVLRPRRAASPLHRNKKRHSHSRSPTATPAPSDLFMAVPASRIRSTSCLRFLTSGLLNCGAPLSARAVASPLSPSDTASSQAASCGRTRLFKGTMTTASTFTSRAVAAATAGPSQAVGAGRPPPSHAQLLFARPGLTRPVSGGGWTSSPVLLLRVQRNHSLLTSSSRQYSSQVLTDEDELPQDDDNLTFNTVPKKGLTFADTLSEDEDVIQVDASVEIVDDSLKVSNPEWNLSKQTIDAIEDKGIQSLFPIQAAVMRPALDGRDLIGRARTGSGKTLAFAIPVVENIMQIQRPQRGRPPLCLVLAPTRELAKQVENEFQSVAPGLKAACFYGGVSIRDQIRELERGVDIVVATPGRCIDLFERGDLDLSQVKYVILDEADQMLAVGFCEDVETILEGVPNERQTLLFSATLPHWVKNITRRFLKDPVMVDTIGESDTGRMSDTITALACQVSRNAKASVLVDLIAVYGKGNKTIVFTQTKREADEVCAGLSRIHPCEALHGDIGQDMREKTLNRFREGRINVLVATDVAARGLDIPNVDLVVHFDLPQEAESFLHRSGRTGRAGRKGTAIALLGPEDTSKFQFILKSTKAKVEMVAPPGPEEVMRAASLQVANRLDKVDPAVVKFFEPAAERLLQVQDPHFSLAASLAALSGFTEVPKPRSLITQEEGVMTLRLMGKPGRLGSPGSVIACIGTVQSNAGDVVGRIRMLRDGGKEGAAFDVPSSASAQILAHAGLLASQGLTLDVPKTLPMEAALGNRSNERRNSGTGNTRGWDQRGRRNDRSSNWNRNEGRSSKSFNGNQRSGWSDDSYGRRETGRTGGGSKSRTWKDDAW